MSAADATVMENTEKRAVNSSRLDDRISLRSFESDGLRGGYILPREFVYGVPGRLALIADGQCL
jgi:hypothetical protein